MNTTAEVAGILAGVGVLAFASAAGVVAVRNQAASRLESFVRRQAANPRPPVLKRQRIEQHSAIVNRMNRRLYGASFSQHIQLRLVRAGLDMTVGRFMALRTLCTVLLAALGYFLTRTYLEGATWEPPVVGVTALIGGWMLPLITVGFLEGRRLKKFEVQLANTVDAMAGALQAGSSLPQAMEMASREMSAPIGEEMAIVVREMAVGVPMQDAFANLLQRVRSLDLDLLVTAINIQYRVGGNLSQILRSIAHTVRERLRIRGEISILTAQQRMSAYVVSALPAGMVVALFFIAPAYVSKLFMPGIARAMLVTALIGMALGYWAMKKITDIDV